MIKLLDEELLFWRTEKKKNNDEHAIEKLAREAVL